MVDPPRILFDCPSCRRSLAAEVEQEGCVASCPDCGASLLVPDPETAALDGRQSRPSLVAEEISSLRRVSLAQNEAEMDMTPMVDVTFLLLIFFMVTAAFAVQKSFEIPTPETDQPSSQPTPIENIEEDPEVVTVRIDEYNTYYITASAWEEEQEAASKQELMARLREAQASPHPPHRMLILADPECVHEKVIAALDAGNAFRMEEVKLLTADDETF